MIYRKLYNVYSVLRQTLKSINLANLDFYMLIADN